MVKNIGRQGLGTEWRQHDHDKTIDLLDNDDDDEQEQQSEYRTSSRSGTMGLAKGKRRNDGKVVPLIEETMQSSCVSKLNKLLQMHKT